MLPVLRLAQRYRTDAGWRAQVDRGDCAPALAECGVVLPQGVRARIVADTPAKRHLVLPPDPNVALADESLGATAGGSTASSGSTASTASTLGSVVTCVGTAGCAACVGTAGSQ